MSADNRQHLLDNLRNLHLPDPVSLWPLAPGWWLVTFLFSVLFMCCLLLFWQRFQSRSPRVQTRRRLSLIHTQWSQHARADIYLRDANREIRFHAINVAGRQAVAALNGNEWVNWLDSHTSTPFTASTRDALADLCYQPAASADIDAIHQELLSWVKQYRIRALSNKGKFSSEPEHRAHHA